MSSGKKDNASEAFPEEGVFPSAEDFRNYVRRSLKELGVTAGAVTKEVPGQTNPNLVRDIEVGRANNPTVSTMLAIFQTIDRMKLEAKR